MKIIDTERYKKVISKDYNFVFDKNTGFFARWGKTEREDPSHAPAPEILDLEISSGGDCLGACPFCYKRNGEGKTYNMSLEEFKTIFHKMPKLLTQIAFGIMNISTNPDFFKMMEYSRVNGVIPNYTCHGLDTTKEVAKRTAELCGAVSVSLYNKEKTYDSIKLFTDEGMTQVNMHYMLARETYDKAFEIIDDIASDDRLKKMNAIVFLQLKKKGRAEEGYSYIESYEDYKKLIEYAEEKGVNYGFDSCSAPLFFKSVENRKEYSALSLLGEPCESSMFSAYINHQGMFFPCSFSENVKNWEIGLDVLNCSDFIKDIWNNKRVSEFRNSLIGSSSSCISCKSKNVCRSCQIYPETAACKWN